jgi:hypothetical protein
MKMINDCHEKAAKGWMIPTALLVLLMGSASAQPPKAAPAAPAKKAAATTVPNNPATLLQLMRGTLFPESNVIFAAQNDDPAKVKPAKDPALATDPLMSAYGGWTAVENASIAIIEVSSLLSVPGRKCSNGRDVPLKNPDWPKLVQGLRQAGMAAYQAAQAKDQDKILDVSGTLSEACAACHDKYREKPTRCM